MAYPITPDHVFCLMSVSLHHRSTPVRRLAELGLEQRALRAQASQIVELFWLKPITREEEEKVRQFIHFWDRHSNLTPTGFTCHTLHELLTNLQITLLNMQIEEGLFQLKCFRRKYNSIGELRQAQFNNLATFIMQLFERSTSYMRTEIDLQDEDSNDLPILEDLTPSEILDERDCQEVYRNEYVHDGPFDISPEDSHSLGIRFQEFYRVKQRFTESIGNFGIRICKAFRKAFPFENPMTSIACRQVFIHGLLSYDEDANRALHNDVLNHRSLTFEEVFNVFYFCDWLKKHQIRGLSPDRQRQFLNRS